MLSLLIAAQIAAFNAEPPNDPAQQPAFAGQTRAPERKAGVAFKVSTVAAGLENPWALAFLPDGQMLVTERPGRLRVVAKDGTLSAPVSGLLPLVATRQGGLLDVALDPDFASNSLIYWSYSEPQADDGNNTAVARGKLVMGSATRIEGATRIFSQAPSLKSPLHFGSRLVFARDGTLFITTGDRSITEGRMQARKPDSLIGKIVRINRDGSIPADNPYVKTPGIRPEIWSWGHRNVQGATLHPKTGELWEVEHGARGGDELNVVRPGKDYGWPNIAYGIEYRGGKILDGDRAKPGLEQPRYYWDPIIAPSGLAFYTGNMFPAWKDSLFVGGLRSTALVRLTMDGEKVIGEERLLTDLEERIRDVRQGPDGALYVLTDNPAGRILKIAK
jgi:glucose/arabinose dehydrogenase